MDLADRHRTLAEILGEHGFCTAGLSANPLVSRRTGLSQGFDSFQVIGGPWRERTATLLRELDDQLDEMLAQDCRIFFFLNLMDAHIPYNTGPHGEAFGAESAGPVGNAGIKWAISSGARELLPEERTAHRAAYDAAVRELDDAARTLVDQLAQRDLLQESLLVWTADHGDGLGAHDEMGHSISVWEEQLGVPLIVGFPDGSDGGRRIDGLRSQLALAPSILDWLGMPRPPEMARTPNLLDDQGPGAARRVLADYRSYFSESNRGANRKNADKYPTLAASVPHRHVVYCGDHKLVVSSDQSVAFYDLAADPEEQTDLSAQMTSALRECQNTYDLLTTEGAHTSFELTFDGDSPDLSSLRALGYVQ